MSAYQHQLTALKNHDNSFIQQVYQDCSPSIKQLILSNGGSISDAKEMFQKALIDTYEKALKDTFTLRVPICNYLYRVCKNMWLNELRKKGKHVTISDVEGYKDDGTGDVMVQQEEAAAEEKRVALMMRHFHRLGKQCQQILKMRWFEKKSYQVVAEQLDISYGYARRRGSECMQQWRRLIEEIID